jgi:hypothetical protein
MEELTVDDKFMRLFWGNPHKIGTDEGGSRDGDLLQAMKAHLTGLGPIGVYPMVQEGTDWLVKWGCVDFDEGYDESWPDAVNLTKVLDRLGIAGWPEKSRSKGYHVWVFADGYVPAAVMRRALQAACQIVGAPTREVNPKQETLGDGQIGNYVRLPYHARVKAGSQHMVDMNGTPLSYSTFVENAYTWRSTRAELERVAAMYEEPELPVYDGPIHTSKGPRERLSGLAHTMIERGRLDGHKDRSSWLWQVARELAKCELTFNEQCDFLYEAHDRHAPKWAGTRDNGRAQLDRMMAKARG